MRSLLLLALALFAFSTLRGAVDDPPRKKGGFTGATPKPATQESFADESDAPPKKPAATPKPKKPATAKAKKSEDDEEATPAPKRKSEADIAPKKSAAAESTPRPKKAAADEDADASPKKKHKASEDDAEPKKESVSETPAKTSGTEAPAKREHAPAATLEPSDLAEFPNLQPRVQSLITSALELTKQNLTYTYGSDDPAQGGMDCSGTMAYVLRAQGFKDVPRDSSSQYVWARKAGPFFAVVSKSAESFEFKDLQPGDLLFWTGTYETGREIPISHVMLYLGTEKKTKKRVMFGSSDGRSYAGIQRWGVSVFDFKMPNATGSNGEASKVDFVGYGKIPQLRESPAPDAIVEKATTPPEPTVSGAATPKPSTTSKSTASSSSTRKKKRRD